MRVLGCGGIISVSDSFFPYLLFFGDDFTIIGFCFKFYSSLNNISCSSITYDEISWCKLGFKFLKINTE